MNNSNSGLLILRAIRQLTPEVFQHPVWLRFAAADGGLQPACIRALEDAARQMQDAGDTQGACSVLFLCAARLAWLGDPFAALDCIARAIRLGRQYHWALAETWGYWAASAVCAQMGELQRAAEFLRPLQAALSAGDWVLADLVEMLAQALEKMAGAVALTPHLASAEAPTNPLLRPALAALLEWGRVPQDAREAPEESPPNGWRARWRLLWQRIQRHARGSPAPGELQIARAEATGRVQGQAPWDDFWITVFGKEPSASAPPGQAEESGAQPPPAAQPPQGANEHAAAHSAALAAAQVPHTGPILPALDAAALPVPVRSPAGPTLTLYFFGAFRLYQDDQQVVDWPSQKSLSILKYLAANHGKPVPKDVLMDTFWSEADAEVARRNLHQAIYALRLVLKRLRPDYAAILFENDCYRLNPDLDLWLDFEAFEQHVQAGRRLEQAGRMNQAVVEYGIAQELYPGDFLQDDLYENWPAAQRTYFRTLYLDLLDRLCAHYLLGQDYYTTIILCQKILTIDNCAEQAYRSLIHCYLAQGQRQLAVREYQTCVQALNEELNLSPSEETRALYAMIMDSPA